MLRNASILKEWLGRSLRGPGHGAGLSFFETFWVYFVLFEDFGAKISPRAEAGLRFQQAATRGRQRLGHGMAGSAPGRGGDRGDREGTEMGQ